MPQDPLQNSRPLDVQTAVATVGRLRDEHRRRIRRIIRSVDADVDEHQGSGRKPHEVPNGVRKQGLSLHMQEIEHRRLAREADDVKPFGLLQARATEIDPPRVMNIATVNLVDGSPQPLRPARARMSFKLQFSLFPGSFQGAGLTFGRFSRGQR